jgi:hypothetical protein
MGVVQHGPVQGIAALVGLPQFIGSYPLCLARNLDIVRMWRSPLPHHNGQAGHAFATDDPNFDAGLVRTVSNHGGKVYLNEVDMIDASIAAF